METKRLKFIDGAKGFAILFVVFYHLLWVCVKDKDSSIIPVFNSVCMQLFFFISGYVSYKSISKISTAKDVFANLSKKARSLLLPSIFLFLFCVWYFQQDLVKELFYEFKAGYWFTYVLFFILLLHHVVVYLLGQFGRFQKFLIPFVILFAFLASWHSGFPYKICEWFRVVSLSFILKYYFFFLMGYLFNQYRFYIQRALNSSYLRHIVFIVSFLFVFIPLNVPPYLALIISLAQVVFVLIVFKNWETQAKDNYFLNQLAFIGRHSMEIYFIHYYFIFGLPQLHEFIEGQDALYVVRGPGSKATIEIITLLPISIILVYISILLRKLFDFAPKISTCLFGPIPK